uniref:Ig-like domain-containing protein n=1 Tax=Anas platyrhynchos platyrhynchos TaxID=8840 RepID=A0A493TMJ4_ANAPP
ERLRALLGVEPSSPFPLPPSRSAPLQAGGPRPQLGHHRQQGRAALHRDGRLPAAHLPLVPGHHADAQRPQNQPDLQELLLHAGFHHRGAGECRRSGRGDPRPPQPRSRSSPLPLQTFEPVTSFDTGDYYCEASNNVGSPQKSDTVHMEANEVNVGGIVAAVVVLLMVLALIAFGIWFAYSRGYFSSEFCTTHPSPGLAPPCASTAFPAAPPPPQNPVPLVLFQREKSK